MRFEQSIDIDAPPQRVWDVLTDLEAWPQRIETVDVVELLTQMTADQITISLGGELDPGLIRPLTGDDYLGVVMPMRI